MQSILRTVLLSAATGVLCLTLPAPALAYDQSWYRADFWGGEYPHGFTMSEAMTVGIRAEADPEAARSIDCALEAGATYHAWNGERVQASNLEFVTYSPIAVYEIATPIEAWAVRHSDGAETTLSLKRGDRWTYLTYLAEGMFLMQHGGETYEADQELFEASQESEPIAEELYDDEWMKLTCANGSEGWLLFGDVAGQPGFDEPNIVEYGRAEDRR